MKKAYYENDNSHTNKGKFLSKYIEKMSEKGLKYGFSLENMHFLDIIIIVEGMKFLLVNMRQ